METIRLLGTRGSIPISKTRNGGRVDKFGGNTSSIAIEGEEKTIIIDAGSGIKNYTSENPEILLAITHAHDDHVIGLGFWQDAYNPTKRIRVVGDENHLDELRNHYRYDNGFFPVDLENMGGIKEINPINGESLRFGYYELRPIKLNHPQGSTGYIIKAEKKIVGIIFDHEHEPDIGRIGEKDRELIEQIKGCDVVIVDGAYTPEEYCPEKFGLKGINKIGWGHSVDLKIAMMAKMAGIERIVLTHHSPDRDDTQLTKREKELQEIVGREVSLAREGESIII